jgi:hypothetical protein
MLSRLRPRLTFANVTSAIALFVALGGGAWAATSFIGSDGQLHACVDKKGALRLVKAGKKCATGESRIAWNQRGPRGLRGARGLAGRDGAAVAVRAHQTADVQTPTGNNQISIPLASNTWTAKAREVALGPYGRFTYTAPPSSSCGGTGEFGIQVTVYVDSKVFSVTNRTTFRDGATRTGSLDATGYLFEPSAAPHTVTVKVSAGCESGPYPDTTTISNLRLDLIRAS